MKKIFALAAAGMMALALGGCANGQSFSDWFTSAAAQADAAATKVAASLPSVCTAVEAIAGATNVVAGQIHSGVGASVAAGSAVASALTAAVCAKVNTALSGKLAATYHRAYRGTFNGTAATRDRIASYLYVASDPAYSSAVQSAALAKAQVLAAQAGVTVQ